MFLISSMVNQAGAQTGSGITEPVSPPIAAYSFLNVIAILNTIVVWLFTIFLIVAVIFIILAAFSYLTSAGDPEKVKAASKRVLFAAVAIAVAILSVSLRFVVQNLLQVPIR